jgi:hypothetical protein
VSAEAQLRDGVCDCGSQWSVGIGVQCRQLRRVRVVRVGQRRLTTPDVELGLTVETAILRVPVRACGRKGLNVLGFTDGTGDRRSHVVGRIAHGFTGVQCSSVRRWGRTHCYSLGSGTEDRARQSERYSVSHKSDTRLWSCSRWLYRSWWLTSPDIRVEML